MLSARFLPVCGFHRTKVSCGATTCSPNFPCWKKCLCTCYSSNFDVLGMDIDFHSAGPRSSTFGGLNTEENSRVPSFVRSSRLILSVMTSRSASIVHNCGAEFFTRIGGDWQVLFQISSEHCPGICACLQCWKILIHAATEL